MKLYGSLNNRLYENKMYCDKIEVGTYATKYYYTDREAYEVVEVINQEHIKIRQLNAIRTDNNGMSDCQSYRYESDLNSPIEELKFMRNNWYEVFTYAPLEIIKERVKEDLRPEARTEEIIMTAVRLCCKEMTKKQWEKYLSGQNVKVYKKLDCGISFGVADEYYDYCF